MLSIRLERDTTPVQIIDDVDEAPERPRQPVKTPNHQHLTLAGLFECLGKLRPICPGA